MDTFDFSALAGERRDRFFARSAGTLFSAKAGEDGSLAIDLYDEIGYWGTTAKDFRSALKDARGDVTLRINSPGGDVFDGMAIHADLNAHKAAGYKVKVEVSGLAASIASIIAMAGDEIVMAPGSFMMVHNAWTIGIGNRHDFADVAGTLTKIDDVLARTYAERTKSGIRQIKTWMDDETWMTAKEAVEHGFATSVSEAADTKAKARFDLSVFSSVPSALVWPADTAQDEPPTKRDLERALTQDAGWTRSKARAAMRAIEPIDEPLQDAGEVNLTAMAEAILAVSATLQNRSQK